MNLQKSAALCGSLDKGLTQSAVQIPLHSSRSVRRFFIVRSTLSLISVFARTNWGWIDSARNQSRGGGVRGVNPVNPARSSLLSLVLIAQCPSMREEAVIIKHSGGSSSPRRFSTTSAKAASRHWAEDSKARVSGPFKGYAGSFLTYYFSWQRAASCIWHRPGNSSPLHHSAAPHPSPSAGGSRLFCSLEIFFFFIRFVCFFILLNSKINVSEKSPIWARECLWDAVMLRCRTPTWTLSSGNSTSKVSAQEMWSWPCGAATEASFVLLHSCSQLG